MPTHFYPSNTTSPANTTYFIDGKPRYQVTVEALNTEYEMLTTNIPISKTGEPYKARNKLIVKINSVVGKTVNYTFYSSFYTQASWNNYGSVYRKVYVKGELEQDNPSLSSCNSGQWYSTPTFTKSVEVGSDGKLHIQFNMKGYNDGTSWSPDTFYQDFELDVSNFISTQQYVKVNGAYVLGDFYGKINNVFKEAEEIYAKENGVWKKGV